MMLTLTKRILVVLALAVLMMLGAAAPAAIAEQQPASGPLISAPVLDNTAKSPSGQDTICAAADDQKAAGESRLLPINRWSDQASNLHDMYSQGVAGTGDLFAKLQNRFVFTQMLSLGNAMWQASASLTGFATRFCLLDQLGADADQMSAGIGNAIVDGGLATLAVVIAVGLALWRAARGKSEASRRPLLRTFLILGLLAVMLTGAQGTTGPGHYGTGSPAWFAVKANNTVSTLGSLPVLALTKTTTYSDTQAPGGAARPATDCSYFLTNMQEAYKQRYGSVINQMAAATPLTMDAMWQESGLAVFVQQQFGQENALGKKTFCRYLEWAAQSRVGASGDTRYTGTGANLGGTSIGLSFNGNNPPEMPTDGSLPFYVGPSKHGTDVQVIGWAACDWNGSAWTVAPEFAKVQGGPESGNKDETITADMCKTWWTTAANDDAAKSTAFWWDDDQQAYTDSTAGAPEARNFIASLHGWNPSGGFALAFSFLLSSLAMLVVHGGIALALIVAKVAAIVMLILIFLVLLISLFGTSTSSRLSSYVKTFLGLTIFTFAISAIFALIALTTGFLVRAGARQFGGGSLMGVLWTGLAPLIAVLVLHMIFTKALRIPSPFKPSSAMAYGTAAGGIGLAAGTGLGALSATARARATSGLSRGAGSMLGFRRPAPTALPPGADPMRMNRNNTAVKTRQESDDPATGGVDAADARSGAVGRAGGGSPSSEPAAAGGAAGKLAALRHQRRQRSLYRSGASSPGGSARIAAAQARLRTTQQSRRDNAGQFAAAHAPSGPVVDKSAAWASTRGARMARSMADTRKVVAARAGVVGAKATARVQRTAERAKDAVGSAAQNKQNQLRVHLEKIRANPVKYGLRAGAITAAMLGPGPGLVGGIAAARLATRATRHAAEQVRFRNARRSEMFEQHFASYHRQPHRPDDAPTVHVNRPRTDPTAPPDPGTNPTDPPGTPT